MATCTSQQLSVQIKLYKFLGCYRDVSFVTAKAGEEKGACVIVGPGSDKFYGKEKPANEEELTNFEAACKEIQKRGFKLQENIGTQHVCYKDSFTKHINKLLLKEIDDDQVLTAMHPHPHLHSITLHAGSTSVIIQSDLLRNILIHDSEEAILACLIDDRGFRFDSHDVMKHEDISLLQVPLYGASDHSVEEKLYAKNTLCYFIPCGITRSDATTKQAVQKILKKIRKATVAQQKEGVSIVLANGKYLTGAELKFFKGDKYEPNIYYWDKHLYDNRTISHPFIEFDLCPAPASPLKTIKPDYLITWSIPGYKEMVAASLSSSQPTSIDTDRKKIDVVKIVAQMVNEEYLTISEDGKLCTSKSKTQLEVAFGLPSPTNPCNWDRQPVLMIKNKALKELVFLQGGNTKESIAKDCIKKFRFAIFRCDKVLHRIQYCNSIQNEQLQWQEKVYNELQPFLPPPFRSRSPSPESTRSSPPLMHPKKPEEPPLPISPPISPAKPPGPPAPSPPPVLPGPVPQVPPTEPSAPPPRPPGPPAPPPGPPVLPGPQVPPPELSPPPDEPMDILQVMQLVSIIECTDI